MPFRHNDGEEGVSSSVYQITRNAVWCVTLPNTVVSLPLRHFVFEETTQAISLAMNIIRLLIYPWEKSMAVTPCSKRLTTMY